MVEREWEREKPKKEAKTGKNKQTSRTDQKTISNYLLLRTFFWLQIYVVEGFPDRK